MEPLHDPDALRAACARVAAGSRFVAVDATAIPSLADDLLATDALDAAAATDPVGDPWSIDAHHDLAADFAADIEAAIALVVALDTINFGSGWHDVVTKRPGMSGATSMATSVREWAAHAPITTARLRALDLDDVIAIFGQDRNHDATIDLMGLFHRTLDDLGRFVDDHHGGSFTALVESADGSAISLATHLTEMRGFDDVAHWTEPDGTTVTLHFDKRAQLTAADLHRAFHGEGPGRFHDLDRLTAFADNLVPHVLGIDGVLRFVPELRARIDRGELLLAGSEEEVEIRALGVHGVELLRAELLGRGHDVASWRLDGVLWRRGGGATYKAVPRHRARSPFY